MSVASSDLAPNGQKYFSQPTEFFYCDFFVAVDVHCTHCDIHDVNITAARATRRRIQSIKSSRAPQET